MTDFVTPGTVTSAADNSTVIYIYSPDSLYVTETGLVYATGVNTAATGGSFGTQFTIAGELYGTYGIACTGNSGTTGDNEINVLDTGKVTGTSYGLFLYGSQNRVTTAGAISGGVDGIYCGLPTVGAGGNTIDVLERGTVTGTSHGLNLDGSETAVTNAGSITGGVDGIYCADISQSIINLGTIKGGTHGIELADGALSTITNSGTIIGDGPGTSTTDYGIHAVGNYISISNTGTIDGGSFGVFCDGNFTSLVNDGTISGQTGVQLETSTASTSRIVNDGTIRSTGAAIVTGFGDDTVVNRGLIDGYVDLGGGNDSFDGRTGTVTDAVYGGDGNDRLLGSAGDDLLSGGLGDDVAKGYAGDDTYLYDSLLDVTSEKGGSGEDTVYGYISVDLVSGKFIGDVEDVVLVPSLGNLNAYGNTLANLLTGNEGNNTLDGRTGADSLVGLAGNDTYLVDNAGDVVDEAAGSGSDKVRSSIAFSLAASATVLGLVEQLELTGSGNVAGTGNANSNLISGNAGANLLTGAGGSDTFRFVTALTATNADTLADFDVATDTIALDNAVMTALGTTAGALAAAKFWSSAAGVAHDADDRVIYDTDNGILWYDADGTGAGVAIRIANLAAGLAMTSADISII